MENDLLTSNITTEGGSPIVINTGELIFNTIWCAPKNIKYEELSDTLHTFQSNKDGYILSPIYKGVYYLYIIQDDNHLTIGSIYTITVIETLSLTFISNDPLRVTLPIEGINTVANIQWGDGNIDNNVIPNQITHEYNNTSNITVTIEIISGTINHFGGENWEGVSNLLEIRTSNPDTWGLPGVNNLDYLCYNAKYLSSMPIQIPHTVTSLQHLFENTTIYNQYIGNWDITRITDMSHMFENAVEFNQPIRDWNTANVTSTVSMFKNATNFNQPIGDWNMKNVTSTASMFESATDFNQDIHDWDTSNIKYMNRMFCNTKEFSFGISHECKWDTRNVINMNYMFYNAHKFDGIIHNWNVSNVKTANNMFENAILFSDDLSIWNIQPSIDLTHFFNNTNRILVQYRNMNYHWKNYKTGTPYHTFFTYKHIFTSNSELYTAITHWFSDSHDAHNTYGHIRDWITTHITDMSGLFKNCTKFNYDISNWDVSNVTNMSKMFSGANVFNKDISTWNITNVKNTAYMFYNTFHFNQDVNKWNTSQVTDMSSMFRLAYGFNSSLSNWDTTNVLDMNHMFAFTPDNEDLNHLLYNTSSFNVDISMWNTLHVTDMSNMFENAIEFNQPIGNWNTSQLTNMSHMFKNVTIFNRPLLWDTSSVFNMSSVFYNAVSFNQNINHWNTSNVTYMDKMFYNALNYNKPMYNWDTSNVLTMFKMFYNAHSFDQNVRYWTITPNVYLKHMFKNATAFLKLYCQETVSYDLCNKSGTPSYKFFKFDKITNSNIYSAVEEWIKNKKTAYAKYGHISDWDTSRITDMNSLFYKRTSFNDDISRWNTSNVTSMYCMFSGATLFNQDLNTNGHKWTVHNVTDMQCMFENASRFNGNISNWNTVNVINMAKMFKNATNFSQQLASDGFIWNTSNVLYMNEMFYNATSFKGEISGWDTNNVIDMNNIFYKVPVFENVIEYVKDTVSQTISEIVVKEIVEYLNKNPQCCGNGTLYNTLYNSVGIDIYNLLNAFVQEDTEKIKQLLSYDNYTSLVARLYDMKIDKNDMTEEEFYFERFRTLLTNSIEGVNKSSLDMENQKNAYDELFQKYKMLTDASSGSTVMSATSTLDTIAEIRPEIIRYIDLYGYPENHVFNTDKLAEIIAEI